MSYLNVRMSKVIALLMCFAAFSHCKASSSSKTKDAISYRDGKVLALYWSALDSSNNEVMCRSLCTGLATPPDLSIDDVGKWNDELRKGCINDSTAPESVSVVNVSDFAGNAEAMGIYTNSIKSGTKSKFVDPGELTVIDKIFDAPDATNGGKATDPSRPSSLRSACRDGFALAGSVSYDPNSGLRTEQIARTASDWVTTHEDFNRKELKRTIEVTVRVMDRNNKVIADKVTTFDEFKTVTIVEKTRVRIESEPRTYHGGGD